MYILGWIVLAGKIRIKNPHMNFRHVFAGSSNSSNDVCPSGSPSHMTWLTDRLCIVCNRDVQGLFSYGGWKHELCSECCQEPSVDAQDCTSPTHRLSKYLPELDIG